MTQNKVDQDRYNDDWLNSAWGEQGNLDLLEKEIIAPRPRVARALELAQLKPGQTMLDIACGRGEVPALASDTGAFAIGIDFSEAAIAFSARLREKRRENKQNDMQLIRGDACQLPFGDNCFDRITMLDIIEHLVPEQLESMLKEVRRLLKPNGYAVIHTLPNEWVYDITFPLLHKLHKKFPKNPRGPHDSVIHVNEQSLPTLYSTVKNCGLKQHLWLEQHMAAQARWNVGQDKYGDNRDTIYPMLAGRVGKALEIACNTPLKLLLSNDIFGVLWKDKKPPLKLPFAFTETITCKLGNL